MRRRRALTVCALAVVAPVAGCSDRGNRESAGDEARLEAFESALEREGILVQDLALDGDVVHVEYAPGDGHVAGEAPSQPERIEASVDAVARAFFDRVYGGWDVERLEAAVLVDGDPVVTWHLESAWIGAYLDGEMTRAELAGNVEDTVERVE